MSFECKHCGQCCIDECTQINISIGDIIRISDFTKLTIGELMKKIGLKPFGDPEHPSHFEYELGLNIPCEFRVGGKCSIYPARPLNCRMFPYVFLGNVEKSKLKDVIDPSHKCISEGIEFTEEEKKKYKDYAEVIGNLILKEAEVTEKFYNENNLKQKQIIPEYLFPAEDPNDPMHAKEISKSKIKLAMSMMKKTPDEELKSMLQNFIMKMKDDAVHSDDINEKEAEILRNP